MLSQMPSLNSSHKTQISPPLRTFCQPLAPSDLLPGTLKSRSKPEDPDPGTGPPDRHYMPVTVIHWGHTARYTCHPGESQTLLLIILVGHVGERCEGSDRGPQFISQTYITFCSSLGGKVCLSSGYHPQNGETEWLNQELEAAPHLLSYRSVPDWSFSGKSPPHPQAGLEPDQALFRTAPQNKRYADCICTLVLDYSAGQKVGLAARDVLLKALNRKLSPRYTGPYETDFVLSPRSVSVPPLFAFTLLSTCPKSN